MPVELTADDIAFELDQALRNLRSAGHLVRKLRTQNPPLDQLTNAVDLIDEALRMGNEALGVVGDLGEEWTIETR